MLHHVAHRARDKRLSDNCFIMNVEDTHLINYSAKKLKGLGVVAATRSGKEVIYTATELGGQFVERYREIREACLYGALNAAEALNQKIGELARLLRALFSVYKQAARAPPRCSARCLARATPVCPAEIPDCTSAPVRPSGHRPASPGRPSRGVATMRRHTAADGLDVSSALDQSARRFFRALCQYKPCMS